jgi:hypothetical protein
MKSSSGSGYYLNNKAKIRSSIISIAESRTASAPERVAAHSSQQGKNITAAAPDNACNYFLSRCECAGSLSLPARRIGRLKRHLPAASCPQARRMRGVRRYS